MHLDSMINQGINNNTSIGVVRGDWGLKILPSLDGVELDIYYSPSPTVVFENWFYIPNWTKGLVFHNIHREITSGPKRKGIGTYALCKIEESFTRLGRLSKRPVSISFGGLEKQEDTRKWLLKNGYTPQENNYVKDLIS
jgi:hypothetical protein